jgi:hypothetical protein
VRLLEEAGGFRDGVLWPTSTWLEGLVMWADAGVEGGAIVSRMELRLSQMSGRRIFELTVEIHSIYIEANEKNREHRLLSREECKTASQTLGKHGLFPGVRLPTFTSMGGFAQASMMMCAILINKTYQESRYHAVDSQNAWEKEKAGSWVQWGVRNSCPRYSHTRSRCLGPVWIRELTNPFGCETGFRESNIQMGCKRYCPHTVRRT